MKIKEEYFLQNIADKWVVFNINGKSVNFNRILSLNESGKFLWELMKNDVSPDALVNALAQHFGINEDLARADAEKFIRELKELECVDYEE